MKLVLNPKYEHLRSFVETVPTSFNDTGNIVQARRNVIKSLNVDGLHLNIKRFRKPIFINRLVYTYIRGTKASKAYNNATEVIKRGFSTPDPLAYIELYKGGLLDLSYFVSIQLDDVREIREYYFTKLEGNEKQFISDFARYTAGLHDTGILHLDYSPGNILISEKNGGYDFSLVDINRMQFKEVGIDEGCENFCRLFEYDEASEFIAKEYALARNLDVNRCTELVLKYKHAFERKKERKKKIKRIFNVNTFLSSTLGLW